MLVELLEVRIDMGNDDTTWRWKEILRLSRVIRRHGPQDVDITHETLALACMALRFDAAMRNNSDLPRGWRCKPHKERMKT